MIQGGCPGASAIKGTPTLKEKSCPSCGGEIEMFSNEVKVVCKNCGFVAYNDTMSCVRWCKFARECVGDELYELFTQKIEDVDQEIAKES